MTGLFAADERFLRDLSLSESDVVYKPKILFEFGISFRKVVELH